MNLNGFYDLHVHCAPDILERSVDDYEMARLAAEEGMKGFVIKSHYTSTSARAGIIRRQFPQVNAVGGICLNITNGGINPAAVEAQARMDGKMVWFPTMDSAYCQEFLERKMPYHLDMQRELREKGITWPSILILNEKGRLCEAAQHVLEVIASHDMVVCTGHISPDETIALIKGAKAHHVRKVVVTHVNWDPTWLKEDYQLECVKHGAFIEYCYASQKADSPKWPDILTTIKRLGPEHVVLSNDLGQSGNILPADGLKAHVIAKKNKIKGEGTFSFKKFLTSGKDAVLALMMPVIILGGIYSGIFTATESADVAVIYGIIVSTLVYKEISIMELFDILKKTAVTTANLLILIASASMLGWMISYFDIPNTVANGVMQFASNKTTFLCLIFVVLVVTGMFMDAAPAAVILPPIFAPLAAEFGIDPVHFGLITVYLLCVGLATPPFGPTLFVSASISGESMTKISKQLIPFIGILLGMGILFMAVPALSIWLPGIVK